MRSSTLAIAAALGATPALAQPGDIWDLIGQIQIDELVTEDSYEVRKSFPAGISETDQEIEISGYVAPMFPGEQVRELIMVSDMGFCPFCGDPDHGASLQVSLADPIGMIDEGQRITLRGQLSRVNDPETWQAVVLKGAQVVTR